MELTIRLFGLPEITQDGRALDLPRRKSRALAYFLAAQPGPVRREALLPLFWIDLPRPSALQTLRTTLHGLKKALGEALLLDGDEIRLDPQVFVDVRAFESGLPSAAEDPARLAAVMDLYRGPLLQGFQLPDGGGFEDWAVLERERLARLARRGWQALAGLHEAAGDYQLAIQALEQALRENPLQEDLQREVIRLLFQAGDRPGAIRRYDQLRRLLDDEMGVPPMAETRALYDAILNETHNPAMLARLSGDLRRRPLDLAAGRAPARPA
ncbi:MAG: BTAD domain-containing putative transcriptional regulator, partial [Chloroflexota bacterium]